MSRKVLYLLFSAVLMLLLSCQLSAPGNADDGLMDGPDVSEFDKTESVISLDAGKAYVSGMLKDGVNFVVRLSGSANGYAFNELAEDAFREGVSLKAAAAVNGYSYPDGISDIVVAQDVAEGSASMVLRVIGAPKEDGVRLLIPIQKKYVSIEDAIAHQAALVSKDGNGSDEENIKNISASVVLSGDASGIDPSVVFTGGNVVNYIETVDMKTVVLKPVAFDLVGMKFSKAAADYFSPNSNGVVLNDGFSSSKVLTNVSELASDLPSWLRISVDGTLKEGDTQLRLIIYGYPPANGQESYDFNLKLKSEWLSKLDDKVGAISSEGYSFGFTFQKRSGDEDISVPRIVNMLPNGRIDLTKAADSNSGMTGIIGRTVSERRNNIPEYQIMMFKLENAVLSSDAEKVLAKGADFVALGGIIGLPDWVKVEVAGNDVKYGYKALALKFSIRDGVDVSEKTDPNKKSTYRLVIRNEWVAKQNSKCADCYDDLVGEWELIGYDNTECEGCVDTQTQDDPVGDDPEGSGEIPADTDPEGDSGEDSGEQASVGTKKLVEIFETSEFMSKVKGSSSGITVFEASKPGCGYCQATRTWLDTFAHEAEFANVGFYVAETLGRGDVSTSAFSDGVATGACQYGIGFGTPLIIIYLNGEPKFGISQPQSEEEAREFVNKVKTLSSYVAGEEDSEPDTGDLPPSGESEQSTQPGGSQSQAGDSALSVDAGSYFVRPRSGSNFSLNVSRNSDIWYIFTNTSGSAKQRPNVPSQSFGYIRQIGDASSGSALTAFSESALIGGIPRTAADFPSVKHGLAAKNGPAPKKSYDQTITINGNYFLGNTATATKKKEVLDIDTKYGKRNLHIYEVVGTVGGPSDAEYDYIASAFLKAGDNNDIFDKVTEFCGGDWGEFNYEYFEAKNDQNGMYYFIPKDEDITVVYANIAANTGAAGGYDPNCYLTEQAGGSGFRLLAMDAPSAAGNGLGEGLTTLAHEFQHLVHGQYYNPYGTYFSNSVTKGLENGNAAQEIFSAMAESYLAQFVAEQVNKPVEGPFGVGKTVNGSGYSTSAFRSGSSFWRPARYLTAFSKLPFDSWTESGTYDEYANGNTLAYYVLVNYGIEPYAEYMKGSNPDVAGLIEAINKNAKTGAIDKAMLISNMQVAAMLSNVPGLKAPYSFNKANSGNSGWFVINGCKVPSVNMWLYPAYNDGYHGGYGFSDSGTLMVNDSNNIVMVKQNQAAGTFSAKAPVLPEGVMLTVVAVPK